MKIWAWYGFAQGNLGTLSNCIIVLVDNQNWTQKVLQKFLEDIDFSCWKNEGLTINGIVTPQNWADFSNKV